MMNRSKLMSLFLGAGLLILGTLSAAPEAKKKMDGASDGVFYVYTDQGSRLNHYAPSGWMGDFGDLVLNPGWPKSGKPAKGSKPAAATPDTQAKDTCIQIKYSGQRKQDAE
jgi:hypothetical protein